MTADNRSKTDIHPTAVVCTEASLTGNITVKAGTVIQPNAIIRATAGPIIIGERTMIEETVLIENTNEDGAALIIGEDNFFELGCVVRARSIGSRNIFGVQSVIGSGVIITDGCSIGTRCSVLKQAPLPARTCIYGEHNLRRAAVEDPIPQLALFEVVRKTMPTYHLLQKTKKLDESLA